jgi:hypothetical protein
LYEGFGRPADDDGSTAEAILISSTPAAVPTTELVG